jgi:PAS domain S-box-containing protein
MALVGAAGDLQRVNPALGRLATRQSAVLVGRELAELIAVAGRGRVAAALASIAAGEQDGVGLECEMLRSDGSGFPASVSLSPLRAVDGTLTGFCAHVLDETGKRAAEDERQARREAEVARRTAEAASRAKTWFLSGMAHELHTPMSVILGYAELLETLDLGEERQRSAQHRISQAARHVISLVDDVLDIAKIESGAVPLAAEEIDLAGLVGDVVSLLEPLAAKRKVVMGLDGVGGSGGVVLADRRRLRQVLLNVVSNAIKYNRDGGRVQIGMSAAGARVVLCVTDEGPGFVQESADRLFEPFDRLGAERTPVQGCGLGLPLSKSLAEAMGGALRLSTRNGSGALVEIELPQAP